MLADKQYFSLISYHYLHQLLFSVLFSVFHALLSMTVLYSKRLSM